MSVNAYNTLYFSKGDFSLVCKFSLLLKAAVLKTTNIIIFLKSASQGGASAQTGLRSSCPGASHGPVSKF